MLTNVPLQQVTWDNPAELESYINRLQSAADRLTIENRKLRKCHFDIADKVLLCSSSDSLLHWMKFKHYMIEYKSILKTIS